ncbi:hypothetical protein LTS10_000391 [Elasticomyces elasticus]|nr:hypothetical protein LTS10_000391 [Elasticomyces elasticus]
MTDAPWSPMNPDTKLTTSGLERQTSHGYASSESESRRTGGSTGKKRASRAGTRSVATLSASQLERKRANDREAQRAIRQRTKEHIETLEKTVSDLRGSQESNEKIVAVTQQRNRDLEDEIAYLRSKLHEGGYIPEAPLIHGHRQSDVGVHSGQPTSPINMTSAMGSSIQRPSSASTPRSLSITTGSTGSRHGSFQQQTGYLSNAPASAVTMSDQKPMPGSQPLTAWRSHDGTSSVHPMQAPLPQVQESLHPHHAAVYHSVHQPERTEWAGTPQQYQFPVGSEPQRPQPYEVQQMPLQTSATLQNQYTQPPAQNYPPAPLPPLVTQQQAHPPAQLPQQAEYQGMGVPSPAYQVHPYQHTTPQQAYPPPQPQAPAQMYQQSNQMQMSPMQGGLPGPAGYSTPHSNMQPPPVPAMHYQTPTTPQQYAPQTMHPPLQYRDEATGRSYTMSQYPPG